MDQRLFVSTPKGTGTALATTKVIFNIKYVVIYNKYLPGSTGRIESVENSNDKETGEATGSSRRFPWEWHGRMSSWRGIESLPTVTDDQTANCWDGSAMWNVEMINVGRICWRCSCRKKRESPKEALKEDTPTTIIRGTIDGRGRPITMWMGGITEVGTRESVCSKCMGNPLIVAIHNLQFILLALRTSRC